MEDALIILVRYPELGKVKTRIAKTAGDVKALHIYQQLLQHTYEITSKVEVDCFVFYSDAIHYDDIWATENYNKYVQHGDTLGKRMLHAFQTVFEQGYKRVCIIGSDCFALTTAIIYKAFNHLQTNDVVVGPARDGGYYLLGMQTLYPSLFDIKEWSNADVFHETMKMVHQLNLRSEVLITLSDIDTEEDWNNRNPSAGFTLP